MKTMTIFHGQLSISVPDDTEYLIFDPLPKIIDYLKQIYSEEERVSILNYPSPYYSISIEPTFTEGDSVEELYCTFEYPYHGHYKITDEILQFLKVNKSNSYQYW